MSSMVWKRGAIAICFLESLDPRSSCCTKRPRIRSASRSRGSRGFPSASRCMISDIWTIRGNRLNSARVFSLFSWFSTSRTDGGFPLATASASPTISASSSLSRSISGSFSMSLQLSSTTPERRPMLWRRWITSRSRLTASSRDIRSPRISSRLFSPVSRCSMVSTEKVQRVFRATSIVRASSPHRMKCQYFFELSESTKMFPATSPSILLALSKPRVMGKYRGTYRFRFLLWGTPTIVVRHPASSKQTDNVAAQDRSFGPAMITRLSSCWASHVAIASFASSALSSAE
mmetsp:Transcript_98880/g.178519  ORF Transcript_98880/g.178519 Transcript_98880/m.178519 type:complete len:289 (-) Transcript_98880:302-1168(-)